ncbi:MAG TPA: hypothetical protein VHI77_01750 [Solirubrobacterales bacterium]|jgi:hypothetical protein|nr:hypothetical protein [Solirubrobacterales bacterium]
MIAILAASIAESAMASEFHFESTPSIITGSAAGEAARIEIGATGSSTVICNSTLFEGTGAVGSNTTSTITLRPRYAECSWLEEPATVRTNDCATVFSASTDFQGDAPIQIECAKESSIEIESPSICTLKIGAQSPTNGVHYTNLGSGQQTRITAATTVTGITFTKTGPLCFLVGGSEIRLTGGHNLFAYEDKGSPQANPTTPSGTLEGAQRAVYWE